VTAPRAAVVNGHIFFLIARFLVVLFLVFTVAGSVLLAVERNAVCIAGVAVVVVAWDECCG
jgi:hypothetical protein